MQELANKARHDGPAPEASDELCFLVCDGGGVRGLSSLFIIKKLMEGIDPVNPPKPCDYFDMIGGTSTGGLIAIMLGRLRMTVDEAITAYTDLSGKVFKKQSHSISWCEFISKLPWNYKVQGRFDAEALKAAIIKIVDEAERKRIRFPDPGPGNPKSSQNLPGEEVLLKDYSPDSCKTFVCATNANNRDSPYLFTSYRSDRWPSDMRNKVKIWEAGRATAAATGFFDSIKIASDPSGILEQTFIDGALEANNPVFEMWSEAQDVFCEGTLLEDKLKCLVSVGTGVPSVEAFGETLAEIAVSLIALTTETEKTAERFLKNHRLLPGQKKYYRFDVMKGLEKVGLEESKQMGLIKDRTDRYLAGEKVGQELKQCCNVLRTREWRRLLSEAASKGHAQAETDVAMLRELVKTLNDSNFQWIDNNKAFESWISCKESAILWHADPRNRDTSLLVMHLMNRYSEGTESDSQSCVASYFCKQSSAPAPQNSTERSHLVQVDTGVCFLRSIIAQLLHQVPRLVDDLVKRPKSLASPALYVQMFDAFTATRWSSPSRPHLLGLLEVILNLRENCDLRLFIDNITELGQQDRRGILHTLVDLVQSGMPTRLKVFITTSLEDDCVYQTLKRYQFVDQRSERNRFLESTRCPQMFDRQQEIAIAEIGSTDWILKHPKFVRWHDAAPGHEDNVLRIRGKPGSGKSTLAKAIQNHLTAPANENFHGFDDNGLDKNNKVIVVAHFYSGRKLHVGTAHVKMLGSILNQLVTANPGVFDAIRERFGRQKVNSPDMTNLHLSFEASQQALEIALDFFVGPGPMVCVIIDAIDEAEPTHREEVLTLLRDRWNRRKSRVKWLVLSRPELDINNIFLEVPTVVMEEENLPVIAAILKRQLPLIEADVLACGLREVQSSKDSSKSSTSSRLRRPLTSKTTKTGSSSTEIEASTSEDIHQTALKIGEFINKNANGVVLWVVLILEEIRESLRKGYYTPAMINEKLKYLPRTVEKVYIAMVSRILKDQPSLQLTKAVLNWACFADRPLMVRELWDAMALASLPMTSNKLTEYRAVVPGKSWAPVQLQILDTCGCFVEITKVAQHVNEDEFVDELYVSPRDTIQILHQTAKDFLCKHNDAGDLRLYPYNGYAFIGGECLRYVQLFFRSRLVLGLGLPRKYLVKRARDWQYRDYSFFIRRLNNRPLMEYILDLDPKGEHLDTCLQWFQDEGVPREESPMWMMVEWRWELRGNKSNCGYLPTWKEGCLRAARAKKLERFIQLFGGNKDPHEDSLDPYIGSENTSPASPSRPSTADSKFQRPRLGADCRVSSFSLEADLGPNEKADDVENHDYEDDSASDDDGNNET